MKIKLLIITTLVLLMWSCASTADITPVVETTTEDTKSSNDQSSENLEISDEDAKLALDNCNIARNEAIDAKAPKAAKAEFDNAEELYLKGANSFNKGKYKDAESEFIQAKELFVSAKDIAIEQRDIALKALMEAEQAIAQTELNAEKAIEEGAGGDL